MRNKFGLVLTVAAAAMFQAAPVQAVSKIRPNPICLNPTLIPGLCNGYSSFGFPSRESCITYYETYCSVIVEGGCLYDPRTGVTECY